MNESPRETILSIAKENVMLRWTVLVLAISISAMVAYVIKRPPAAVWLVSEAGQIQSGNKILYSWEPLEFLRRAFEVMFVRSDNRDILLPHFFEGQPLEAAKSIKPDVRFTNFRIESQTITDTGAIIINGIVLRNEKDDLPLSIEVIRSERNEFNPFGLKISSTTLRG